MNRTNQRLGLSISAAKKADAVFRIASARLRRPERLIPRPYLLCGHIRCDACNRKMQAELVGQTSITVAVQELSHPEAMRLPSTRRQSTCENQYS